MLHIDYGLSPVLLQLTSQSCGDGAADAGARQVGDLSPGDLGGWLGTLPVEISDVFWDRALNAA
jgi:hypothetical protein